MTYEVVPLSPSGWLPLLAFFQSYGVPGLQQSLAEDVVLFPVEKDLACLLHLGRRRHQMICK